MGCLTAALHEGRLWHLVAVVVAYDAATARLAERRRVVCAAVADPIAQDARRVGAEPALTVGALAVVIPRTLQRSRHRELPRPRRRPRPRILGTALAQLFCSSDG